MIVVMNFLFLFSIGNTSAKSSSNTNNGAVARIATNNRPVNDAPAAGGLGGLFVNGIPKLKATGLPIGGLRFVYVILFGVLSVDYKNYYLLFKVRHIVLRDRV